MAIVTRENIGVLNDKIVVKLQKDDYLPSFEKAIKDYSKKANIPGFRKGMVPPGMIRKMVGSSLFAEEVNKSVEKGLVDYMQNEKLEIFAQPLPLPESERLSIDMNEPGEYAFAFEVGLKPEFTVADLPSAHIKQYKVTVSDDMIEKQIDDILTSKGEMIEEETVTSDDDEVTLLFIETDEQGNEVEHGISKETLLSVGYFTPTLKDQLRGKKKDDRILAKLSEAIEAFRLPRILKDLDLGDEEQAAGRYFNMQINSIKSLKKGSLNEELFKEVFPQREIASEEDFRNEIRQEIQAQWDNQSISQMYDQIYHELLNHTTIDFPEEFLKRWLAVSGEKEKTHDEVEKDFPGFVKTLKWSLIVDKIGEEHTIEVAPEEIRAYAKHQLMGYLNRGTMDLDEPWIEDYVDKVTKDKKFVEETYHRLKTDKLFAWAATQVTPVEEPISVEDFNKLQEQHKHEH